MKLTVCEGLPFLTVVKELLTNSKNSLIDTFRIRNKTLTHSSLNC